MKERYWGAGDEDEEDWLADLINEHVVEAIKYCWEDDKPSGWIEVKDGRIILVVGGPGKPTAEDPAGKCDIYTVEFDLLEELEIYSDPYAEAGGPCCDAHREEMREVADTLRKLADQIASLAARAAEDGRPSI